MGALTKIYLIAYNLSQSLGWAYILSILIRVSWPDLQHGQFTLPTALPILWPSLGRELLIFQNLAILEVFHSLFGLVKAPLFTTLVQVVSRLVLASAIAANIPTVQVALPLATMIFCWSLTEVIRYGYYTIDQVGLSVPFPVVWLRYSLFIALYPAGVLSELLCIITSMPYFRETGKWSVSLPNRYNFGFDFYLFLFVVLAVYLPGLPMLYQHMLRQRKSKLSPPKPKTA